MLVCDSLVNIALYFSTLCYWLAYRKPPNISPGLIFVRKHFLVGLYMGRLIYGGAYIRSRFCVSNINYLLTLFLYNTRLIYKQA